MITPTESQESPLFEPLRRYVPLVVWTITLFALLLIPLKIIGLGYIPRDDALRHAGKAVSGKAWSEVLVLNDTYKIDHEYGWSLLLEKLHAVSDANSETILIFSVVSLFLLTVLSGLAWRSYPETWLIALVLGMVAAALPCRFLTGRPYLVTMSALVLMLVLWQRFGSARPKTWILVLLTSLITASVYFHGTWYLWVLPITAFFLAREFRWGLTVAGCWVVGVVLGCSLTGHPYDYPAQAIKIVLLATGMHTTQGSLVSELQPYGGDLTSLLLLGGLLVMRRLTGLNSKPFSRDPVFWMVCLGWVLGLKVERFWYDWGWPSLCVLISYDLQVLFASRVAKDSFQRVALAGGVALVAFMTLTSDVGSRWTAPLKNSYLTADNPDLNGWLPEKGGVLYAADMSIFYQTFYKNPTADWRYILGFESTLMPREDFDTYQKFIWNFAEVKALQPWVQKMTPADRLVLRGTRGSPPAIGELEWNYGVSCIWIGRLPVTREGDAPVTIPATDHKK